MRSRVLIGSFGTSASIQAVNVVTGVVLARVLGLEDRGELAAALLWPALLASVGSLGLADAATFHASRRTYPARVLVGTALALAGALAVPLVIFGGLLFPWLLGDYGSETVRAASLLLAYIPLNLAALALMGILAGQQRYRAFNILRFLVVGLSGIAIVALAGVGSLSVTTAAVGYLCANVLTLAVATLAILRVRPGRLAVRANACRALVRFGIRAHVSSVSSLMNERLDQLVISLFLVPASLGLYVVAGTLSSLTLLVGTSVALIALPATAHEVDDARRAATARRAVSLTFLISLLVTAPLLALTPELITLFFGDAFGAAATPARILLVAAVVLGTARSTGAVLKALDRPLQAGSAELMALAVTAVCLAALLPAFGLTGAALASLLAYSTSAAWMLRRVSKALDVSAVSFLIPTRALAPALGTER